MYHYGTYINAHRCILVVVYRSVPHVSLRSIKFISLCMNHCGSNSCVSKHRLIATCMHASIYVGVFKLSASMRCFVSSGCGSPPRALLRRRRRGPPSQRQCRRRLLPHSRPAREPTLGTYAEPTIKQVSVHYRVQGLRAIVGGDSPLGHRPPVHDAAGHASEIIARPREPIPAAGRRSDSPRGW